MNDRDARPAVVAHGLAAIGLVFEVLLLVVVIPRHDQLINLGPETVVLAVVMLAVGWILAWKRPHIKLGWIVLLIALVITVQGPTAAIGIGTLHSQPRLAAWMLWYGGQSQWSWIPPIGLLLTQLPLRFPDGRLPSKRWGWFSWYTIGCLILASGLGAVTTPYVEQKPNIANPAYIGWGGQSSVFAIVVALVLLGTSVAGSVASLFVRYRGAGATERAQLRWIFWAVALVAGTLVLGWFENLFFGDDDAPGVAGVVARTWDLVTGLAFPLIPLAILFAVLRSGLYAIDRIISRTASYAIVSLSVVAVYAGVVLVVSLLLPDGKAVGVALATLAAAAVCLPLLRVVRRAVDRRFNREQYDADKVVDAFGERIRTGVDPHTAGVDLVDAVQRTLQPTALGLWTREDAR